MKKKTHLIFLITLILIVQIACKTPMQLISGVDEAATAVQETLRVVQLPATLQLDVLATQVAETVQAGLATIELPQAVVTEAPIATTQAVIIPTASETPSYSPTPEYVTISVSVDTNCRTGPGTPYPYVGALLVGETAEVVGKFPSAGYWIIKNPDGYDTCWVTGQYATVVGDTSTLKVYKMPPTPTPEFPPSATPTP